MPTRVFLPLLAVCVLVGALGGCGGGGSSQERDDSREQVRSTVRDVAGSLGASTAEVVEAAGQWSVCSAGTSDRLEYAARLGLRADGDPVQLVRAVGQQMGEDGWEVTNEGDTSVNLERGDMRASAKPSRANPEQLTVEVSGGCVDGSRNDVSDLQPEPIEVG